MLRVGLVTPWPRRKLTGQISGTRACDKRLFLSGKAKPHILTENKDDLSDDDAKEGSEVNGSAVTRLTLPLSHGFGEAGSCNGERSGPSTPIEAQTMTCT